MNARTVKAVRRAIRESEAKRIAPALTAVAGYTKSTEQRVSELELEVHKVLGWKSRNLWGRIKWLLAGR